jgi:putative phosphoesterase
LPTTRIGVVADTHYPEFLDELPTRLGEVLEGVELILHAGDVGGPAALRELERIAPVQAVLGDHDKDLDLPRKRVVEVAGHRIGLIHGNRSRLIEEPLTFLGTVSLGTVWPNTGIHGWLLKSFPQVDVVVFGHTHAPTTRRVGGTLLFNPGAVYQTTPQAARARLERGPGWFEWSWLQVIRHRRRWSPPTVGILEIGERGIRASVINL